MGIALSNQSFPRIRNLAWYIKKWFISLAQKAVVGGLECSAVADREIYDKCGRGADSGHNLLMRCGQMAQNCSPRHL